MFTRNTPNFVFTPSIRFEDGQVINGTFNEPAFEFQEFSDENLFWKIFDSYKDNSISSTVIEDDDKDQLKARDQLIIISILVMSHNESLLWSDGRWIPTQRKCRLHGSNFQQN